MASLEELEERRRKLDARRARLDRQIKDKREARAAEERKAETHAKVFIGGMVLSQLGLDWKAVNFEELAKSLDFYRRNAGKYEAEELGLADAKRRLRSYEVERKPWGEWNADGRGGEPQPDSGRSAVGAGGAGAAEEGEEAEDKADARNLAEVKDELVSGGSVGHELW